MRLSLTETRSFLFQPSVKEESVGDLKCYRDEMKSSRVEISSLVSREGEG